jgi:phosphohistidine phosphatase
MKLYILRHGEAADQNDPRFENDADRPLTIKGVRRTKTLAHALRQWDITFTLIISSPLLRARETAEIVERGLRLHGRLEFSDQLAPTGDVEKLVNQINAVRPAPDSVLLVGHEPYLSNLISIFCTGGPNLSLTLKKGGLCRMEVEQLQTARCAHLEWVLAPRLLGSKRSSKG